MRLFQTYALNRTGCVELAFAALLLFSVLIASHFVASDVERPAPTRAPADQSGLPCPGQLPIPGEETISAPPQSSIAGQEDNVYASAWDLLRLLKTQYTAEQVWEYCWMNAAFFVNGTVPLASDVTFVGFQSNVTVANPVIWRLETGIGSGGDVFQASLTGPALIRPRLHDMLNGTYFLVFVPRDAGKFAVNVTMRWPACRGYVFCAVEDTSQPVLEVFSGSLDVSNSNIRDVGAKGDVEHARWILATRRQNEVLHHLLRGRYVWQPLLHARDDDYFPLQGLQNRYVYVIGDSLSEHAFNQLVTDVLPCNDAVKLLVSRFDGSLMAVQNKRDGMQLIHCTALNATLAFSFYPDYFPTGGTKETRFPLIDQDSNSIASAHNVSFGAPHWASLLKAAIADAPELPSYSQPSVVVFNFGLHYATPLDPPLYAILLRHQLMTLRAVFPGTPILWRSTGYTHFEHVKLPTKWNCRTPVRTEILNEVSDRVVRALKLDVLDFRALTAARPDATPDNRHYSLGNVRATYNSLFLQKIAALAESN